MLAVYEPGATCEPLVNGDFSGARLQQLAALSLRIVATRAKFKVGPAGPDEVKLEVARRPRLRAEPHDAHAAEEIEASVQRSGDPSDDIGGGERHRPSVKNPYHG